MLLDDNSTNLNIDWHQLIMLLSLTNIKKKNAATTAGKYQIIMAA